MPEAKDALLKEFELARSRYYELLSKIIGSKIPGAIDQVAARCSYGEACHGGTTDALSRLGMPERK